MNELTHAFERGVRFIKDNPQIIFTLFLLVAIPLAFVVTSEQFLQVARENQNKLERSRVGMLQDTIATFAPDLIATPQILNDRLRMMRELNETIASFRITVPVAEGKQRIIASLLADEIGSELVLDEESLVMIGAAQANPDRSFAVEVYQNGERFWRAVRVIKSGESLRGYMFTDISMSQSDLVSERNIKNAYLILLAVIALIIVLLFRHAKIIDYATLYQRLKEVDQMKDDFVSMAAHELRSPLTVIRGYVDLLRDEVTTEVGKKQLENIDQSATRLNDLIGDILDVARFQEGRMSFNLAPNDIVALCEEVVSGFKKPAEDKLLLLSFTSGPHQLLTIDKERMRQVLVNIIGNAIKYTPKGEVKVTANKEAGRYIIRVSDTGMGISAEDQQRIFKKFYRVKNEETAKIQGTGLGLWITREIVQGLGGVISIESIKGKGTDMIVSFPLPE